MPSSPPFETRTVASVALLYVFRMLGLFMVLPVLVLYGADYAGSSAFLLGLALGAYGFSQALLQIPFGVLADRIGRKPVILAGLLLFVLGSVVAAQADSVYELIVGRLLQGCGAIAGALMALLADLTAEENRTKALALVGASIGVSFALSLILGPLVAAWGGLAAIFWLTAALGLVGMAILWRWIPSAGAEAGAGRPHTGPVPRMLRQALIHGELLRLNLGVFTLHFILMASFLILPQVLEQLGVSREQHWLVYFPLLLGTFVVMLPLLLAAERRGWTRWVFLGAIGLLALSELALLGASGNLPLLLGVLFVFFVAFNALEASLPSLVSKTAPAAIKGTALSVYASCQFFGAFAGGALGGYLLQYQGAPSLFILCSLLLGVWLLVAWGMAAPAPRQLARSATVKTGQLQLSDD